MAKVHRITVEEGGPLTLNYDPSYGVEITLLAMVAADSEEDAKALGRKMEDYLHAKASVLEDADTGAFVIAVDIDT